MVKSSQPRVSKKVAKKTPSKTNSKATSKKTKVLPKSKLGGLKANQLVIYSDKDSRNGYSLAIVEKVPNKSKQIGVRVLTVEKALKTKTVYKRYKDKSDYFIMDLDEEKDIQLVSNKKLDKLK